MSKFRFDQLLNIILNFLNNYKYLFKDLRKSEMTEPAEEQMGGDT